MVYRHMETKEIARELGISPDGVTQRIKGAMRTLGVNKRRDAAHLLAEAEEAAAYPRRVYPPRDIANLTDPGTFTPPTEGGWHSGSSGGVVREEQSAFEVASTLRTQGFRLPLPMWGGRPSDLNASRRIAWIVGVMLVIAFMFGVFLAGLEALSRIGRLIAS